MNDRAAVDKTEEVATCGCRRCLGNRRDVAVFPYRTRMILCESCGNKRCPHASDHTYACTDSNAPGQPGSDY